MNSEHLLRAVGLSCLLSFHSKKHTNEEEKEEEEGEEEEKEEESSTSGQFCRVLQSQLTLKLILRKKKKTFSTRVSENVRKLSLFLTETDAR